MKKYLLFAIFALLAIAGCDRNMDPFEGGSGVRMNVNGKKYVMHGRSDSKPLSITTEGTPSNLMFTVTMTGLSNSFEFSMNSSDPGTFLEGKSYPATAKMALGSEDVALSGTLEFTRLSADSSLVDALFELSGSGADGTSYNVTHGFFRLRYK